MRSKWTKTSGDGLCRCARPYAASSAMPPPLHRQQVWHVPAAGAELGLGGQRPSNALWQTGLTLPQPGRVQAPNRPAMQGCTPQGGPATQQGSRQQQMGLRQAHLLRHRSSSCRLSSPSAFHRLRARELQWALSQAASAQKWLRWYPHALRLQHEARCHACLWSRVRLAATAAVSTWYA